MADKIIVGPLPPAIGGIATIMETLRKKYINDADVYFVDTNKEGSFNNKIFHSIRLLLLIVIKGLRSKGGAILMFSSAYGSFWEKSVWCIVSKLLGLRTIVQMVDGNFPRFYEGMSRPYKTLASICVKSIDVLAVQSTEWSNYYKTILPNTHIMVISPGVDTDFFCPPVNPAINNPLQILYIGWLIEDKGIYDLILAAKLMNDNGNLFRMRLVGPDFGEKRTIISLIEKFKLENKVFVDDPILSRDGIRKAYQEADIFVFPSHFEGFPYALMEAIAVGLPCVGTKVGGIPDILDNNRSGIIIDKNSPEQLSQSLSKLLADDEYRLLMGKRAREWAVHEYSLQKSFEDFNKVLNMNRIDNIIP